MKAKIPAPEVLAWLQEHHPGLHQSVEMDRDWIWLTADLRGDGNKAIRDSINHEGGFKFAKRGHPMPSGKVAYWGHSCDRPIGFKRKGKTQQKGLINSIPGQRPDPLAHSRSEEDLNDLAATFLNTHL